MAIFVNFIVLPSLAVMFDWNLTTLNNNIIEEEVKNNTANFNEKFPPKPYKCSDYILLKQSIENKKNKFVQRDVSTHLSPFISIFSPPPEV
ncbi:hypothetical protein [Chryseobacterium echinoideorum]|uniref:hypothetical protein n=1 Tax=Chryseobacterium echinoideorum TaxID=1549648 RepID=UPI001E5796CE|nr:hypothetical protein [Chryseobacterium echinoideorum]